MRVAGQNLCRSVGGGSEADGREAGPALGTPGVADAMRYEPQRK
jgi:hypothetical protein